MKSSKIILSVLCAFLVLFSSCEDDDASTTGEQEQEIIPDSFSDYFGNQISRNFLGNVIDTNNNPIPDVTVTIGSETATTDSNGVFVFNDATVNQRFGYVKAQKTGYIGGSRSVVPSQGTNKVTIMLLEATVVGTTASGSSETITSNDGSSVSFDGNFIKTDGSEYSGSVDVIMHHLDPADEDMPMQMPGMLYAQNEAGAERMLQTLGMLTVELRGSGGEELNLAEGSTSEIRIPVDPSLMGIAPSTIPLWYFDEDHGYWKEEGIATLVGSMYVGSVSHFSFWNCDIPAEAITLCVSVTNENAAPLSNLAVRITSTTFGTTNGYTNETGEVCGFVPSNETLEIEVYNNDFCDGDALYTDSIGPFSTDSNVELVITENPDVIEELITGTFNTCNNTPVSNGYVQLRYGNQVFTDFVDDGSFEINLLRCEGNNTFGIKGSDYVNLQTTDTISYTFTTPITNIGTISACNSVTEFIQYTIDNEDPVIIFDELSANFYLEGQGQTEQPSLDIFGFNPGTNSCVYIFGVLNPTPDYLGTYDNYAFDDSDDTGFFIGECLDVRGENNNIIYNLNALGAVGDYIDINFSGTYEDFNGDPHSITGVVHVLRDN